MTLKLRLLLIISISICNQIFAQKYSYQIARLKYNGGGDWYAGRTALPNLVNFCNANLNTNIDPLEAIVETGSKELFNHPFIFMTGHGTAIFSDAEGDNMRQYLIAGGFLHIDDNYGLNNFVKPLLKKVFPELDLVELPFNHAIFHQKYDFPNGLPKIHEHDKKAPQAFGLFYEGRMVALYTYETDLCNGWEDFGVHNDSEETRLKALKMGANILQFVLTQ